MAANWNWNSLMFLFENPFLVECQWCVVKWLHRKDLELSAFGCQSIETHVLDSHWRDRADGKYPIFTFYSQFSQHFVHSTRRAMTEFPYHDCRHGKWLISAPLKQRDFSRKLKISERDWVGNCAHIFPSRSTKNFDTINCSLNVSNYAYKMCAPRINSILYTNTRIDLPFKRRICGRMLVAGDILFQNGCASRAPKKEHKHYYHFRARYTFSHAVCVCCVWQQRQRMHPY